MIPAQKAPSLPALKSDVAQKKKPSAPNEVLGATWDRSAARSRRG